MTTQNPKKLKMTLKSNSMTNQDDESLDLDDELFLENNFGTQFPEILAPDILQLLDEDY